MIVCWGLQLPGFSSFMLPWEAKREAKNPVEGVAKAKFMPNGHPEETKQRLTSWGPTRPVTIFRA